MWYAIKAYEGMYEGLHGIVDYDLMQGTQEDAEDYGVDMSRDLIDEYDTVSSYDFDDADEYMYEDIIDDNIRFEVYCLKDLSREYIKEHYIELREEFRNDETAFIAKYCDRRA